MAAQAGRDVSGHQLAIFKRLKLNLRLLLFLRLVMASPVFP